MGKKRATGAHKPVGVTAAGGTADENNVSGGLVPGSTLEDYFHSKKFKDAPVSKHLLVGSPTNNAMAVERLLDDGETEKVADDDPELAPRSLADASDAAPVDADAKAGGDIKHADEKDENERDGDDVSRDEEERDEQATGQGDDDAKETSNRDEYEDDYESESPSPDTSVAGMTLSDYLHAKEAKNLEDEEGDAGAKHTVRKPQQHESVTLAAPKKPGHAAAPAGASKKANPTTLVTGMSLDHYLGAAPSPDHQHTNDGGDPYDSGADSKSPTSKRKKSKHKLGAKSLLSKPVAGGTSSTGNLALAHDDYTTPFQKRQTKKLKAKLRQQQQTARSGAHVVSKAILLADSGAAATTTLSPSHSSQSILLPQTKGAKDKKKLSPHPLPKLVAPSASAHTLLHDADGNGSDDDSSGECEKLPPLAHH